MRPLRAPLSPPLSNRPCESLTVAEYRRVLRVAHLSMHPGVRARQFQSTVRTGMSIGLVTMMVAIATIGMFVQTRAETIEVE